MTPKSTLIGSALDQIYSFNLKQRTPHKDRKTNAPHKDRKTNTPHKDETIKYTVQRREIKQTNM
jgi:hypothetical protein